MNGIDNIIKRIEDDAQRRADGLVEDARREAEEIKKSFDERISAERTAILERGRANAAERELRLSGVSELEARKKSLAEKQRMIGRAFDLAEEKLRALSRAEAAELLSRLALEAAAGGPGEIILSPSDREALGADILERTAENAGITLSDETRETGGGLILRSGTTETNCTFGAIIKGLREGMAKDVADILFG